MRQHRLSAVGPTPASGLWRAQTRRAPGSARGPSGGRLAGPERPLRFCAVRLLHLNLIARGGPAQQLFQRRLWLLVLH